MAQKTAKQLRRQRKKRRRIDADLDAYIRSRIVCDNCGQEQPFLQLKEIEDDDELRRRLVLLFPHLAGRSFEYDRWVEVPCLRCYSRGTARFLDRWMEDTGNEPGSLSAPR